AIEALKADGHTRFLEIGPGDILSALARHGGALTVSSLRRGVDDREQMLRAAATLWRDGAEIDWPAVTGPAAAHVEAPHDPFHRRPYWLDPAPLRPAGWSTQTTHIRGISMASRTQVIDDLVGMLASVTGLEPAEISPSQHLTDMGLDSLMLLKLGQAV